VPLQENPYIPSSLQPLVAEMWQGMRTDTNRVGVPENYDFWYDGFFPYAPRRLRAMPDLGTTIYHTVSPTIVFYKFVNLGSQSLAIIVMSDGSILQLNMTTYAVTTILPAGTILVPTQLTTDINQWGATYVLIVSAQPNGYWVWDGALVYDGGTLGPIITLTSTGSGYTSDPLIVATGGHGSGAVFSAAISGGHVTRVSLVNPGSGYSVGDSIALSFLGGLTAGSGASINALMGTVTGGTGGLVVVSNSSIGSNRWTVTAAITAGGSNYSQFAHVVTTQGSANPYPGIALNPTGSFTGGALVAFVPSSPGHLTGGLYTTSVKPSVSVVDKGYFYVAGTSIIAAGSGYSDFPVITAVVAASASMIATPIFTPGVSGAGRSITSVTIVSGGVFGSATAPTLVITDMAAAASATAQLMPFGIQGNAVETYSGQVWVADGANRYTSAPGSVIDFATSDGGLSVQDNDSFLKVGYTRFIQMNGFLWMVADCSVNYIGNVTTMGSPPVTSYSKQNADPEVGTIWPNTVIPWGNQLLLANSWGVFLGLGSRMQKISDELDGVYGTVPSPAITPSVAKMTLFNRKIVFLLLPIIDSVSGSQQNKLLIWDGKKWWSPVQSKALTYIATQEINSVLTAFGTDGNDIYPLFTTPSSAFTKTLQTRLWDAPGSYLVTKAAGRLFGVARYNSTVTPNLIVRIDNEATDTGSTMATTSTYTITGPTVTGNFVIPPLAIGQTGVFTGLTLQTTAADVEIVSLVIGDEIVGYRG
jgi:hypothetical protein